MNIQHLNPPVERWSNAEASRYRVTVLSTEYKSKAGGIANAMPGYLEALQVQGLLVSHITTHISGGLLGKGRPLLTAPAKIKNEIFRIQKMGYIPVAYAHAGESVSFLRKIYLLSVARKAGAKTVLHLHGGGVGSWLENRWLRKPFLHALSSVDIVCILTNYWKERIGQYNSAITLHVIPNPNPIDVNFSIKEKTMSKGASPEQITILAMSRLEKGKGFEATIRAVAQLPMHYTLKIAGDGSHSPYLRQLVYELGIQERVEFCGWVKEDRKIELLRNSDIFCLPSQYDSFGLVYVEAMHFALPIIALNWGPIPDVVPSGKAGKLIGGQCPDHIADAILQMENPEIRHQLGSAGKKWVEKHFSTDSVGNALLYSFNTLNDN